MQTSEHENSDSQPLGQDDFRALIREKMCAAVRLTLMAVLNEELEARMGAGRYERSTGRRDHLCCPPVRQHMPQHDLIQPSHVHSGILQPSFEYDHHQPSQVDRLFNVAHVFTQHPDECPAHSAIQFVAAAASCFRLFCHDLNLASDARQRPSLKT